MGNYICTEIITQLSLLTFIVLVSQKKTFSKKRKTRIIIATSLVMVCALAEFSGVLLNGSVMLFRPVLLIVKYVEFCLAPIIPICFTTAFYQIESKKTVFILNAIHILTETLSLFYGFVFYIDNNNIYHRGKIYWVYYLFVFLSILFISCTIVKFATRFQNQNNLSLIMIITFIFGGAVFQLINSDVKIVWLTVAIGTILFYIYYCDIIYQIDVLTELLNRRAFETRKLSVKKKAYILIFDVNDFKIVNDKWGHNSGDLCLKYIASAIKRTYRKYGYCYRIGGDEFCVILDRKINSFKIEELNTKFEDQLKEKRADSIEMPSVAVGYAIYEPGKAEISEVIKEADRQMYINKNNKKFF